MKQIILSILLLSFGFSSFAGWRCVDGTLDLIIKDLGHPTTVTVIENGNIIYGSVAVVSQKSLEQNLVTYQSPSFFNANAAPSSLVASVYWDASGVKAHVYEMSYQPIFNISRELICSQISQ